MSIDLEMFAETKLSNTRVLLHVYTAIMLYRYDDEVCQKNFNQGPSQVRWNPTKVPQSHTQWLHVYTYMTCVLILWIVNCNKYTCTYTCTRVHVYTRVRSIRYSGPGSTGTDITNSPSTPYTELAQFLWRKCLLI